MSHIFVVRRTLRFVAAAFIMTSGALAVACSDGGQHDSGEQAGDPSVQPTGAGVRPDSSTQVPQSPAPGTTATGTTAPNSTGTGTAATTSPRP